MKKLSLILLASSLLMVGCSNNENDSTTTITTTSTPSTSEPSPIDPDEPIDYSTPYDTMHGEFQYDVNQILVKKSQSLCLVPDASMKSGTINVDVSMRYGGDNGLIFLAKNDGTSVWEEKGTSYYFYFISKVGTLYLGKSFDGEWTTIYEQQIRGYSIQKQYNLKVAFDTNDNFVQFHCYLNDEYYYSVRDYEKNLGDKFGLRAENDGVTFSYIKSTNNFIEPSRLKVGDFYVGSGSYLNQGSSLVSSTANSIAYLEDEFELGTISVDMVQSGYASDSGIIFGLERAGNVQFWENNVGYYFFFINSQGHAYLGKVNNGSWATLYYSSEVIDNYSIENGHVNNLKIVRDNQTISCYVDNVKLVDYFDPIPLFGKEYGVRTGTSIGLSYKSLSVEKSGEYEFMNPTDYEVIKGEFITTDNSNVISFIPNSLALAKDKTLTNGTLSLKIAQGSTNNTGVIFRSNNDASSYYEFSLKNGRTHLYKVMAESRNELTPSEYISAGYNLNNAYDAKIVINDNKIYCYFSGILYATYHDENMLSGDRYGFVCSAPYAAFIDANCTSSIEVETHKTMVIGHSYMELWTNYKEDLSSFEDVYDIGIGGSVSSDWLDMSENIIPYSPETLIYMIGINDYPRGIAPATIASNVKVLLEKLKERIPSLQKVALVSVNRCVTHEAYKSQIMTTNTLYKQICEELDYVYYANIDDAFLNGDTPDPSCFVDGLHPTSESYLIIADAIKKALLG